MSADSPAAILFDEHGNPIGVNYDGYQYRLLVDSRLTDADGYNVVGITNIAPGINALKVDVVKTVSGGSVGVGGTSSTYDAVFPNAGTAAGFFDGYFMRSSKVFDLDTSGGTEFVLGTNLRTFANGGSVEAGTISNPLQVNIDGYVQTNPNVNVVNIPGVILYDGYRNPVTVVSGAISTINISTNGTITVVPSINSDTQLLASNINRRGVFLYNATTSATLKIGLSSSTVTLTNFSLQLAAGGFFEIPFGYTGQIRGIWSISESDGYAMITELI